MNFDGQMLECLRNAHHIVAFTGAGVSQESGIPTFRDSLTGLWENFDPARLVTLCAFNKDPDMVWGWYEWRRMRVMSAEPNTAHRVIAKMQSVIPKVTVVTQNVDDLHERAGSRNVVHLHGSLHESRCSACGRKHVLPNGVPDEPEGGRRVAPPQCGRCGGLVRPGVVWFGEDLPDLEWKLATQAVLDCDVLLSVGTSSSVMPAASLPVLASQQGKCVIQVNPLPTAHDKVSRFNLVGKAAEIFGELQQAMNWRGADSTP